MSKPAYRQAIADYIRGNAKPPDKFSHQARLYRLCGRIAQGRACDDEVLFAGAWLHDLGVFIGHRPEDPASLSKWDCVAYAMRQAPDLLTRFGFPEQKISAVVEVIRTHQPQADPTTFEGVVLRDADILEQLGAVSILRTVSKVGRDTRFILFSDALKILTKNLQELPAKLKLPEAQRLAAPRVQTLKAFMAAAEEESDGIEW